jgi:hypothetical protein
MITFLNQRLSLTSEVFLCKVALFTEEGNGFL